MPRIKNDVSARLWSTEDPLACFVDRPADEQGWASDNPLLLRGIREVKPKVVVEVGVWKGASVITMATEMRRLNMDGVVIAVDTWLGSFEHWMAEEIRGDLHFSNGYPTLYKTFLANMRARDLADYVVPLPLDSLNAAQLLAAKGIQADIVHIDAGHDFESVMADLRAWWPMISPTGVLIGNDYHPKEIGVWPDVQRAFETFFGTDVLESFNGKCYVPKH